MNSGQIYSINGIIYRHDTTLKSQEYQNAQICCNGW